ncbi:MULTISPECIES: PP0621 family protein [Ramlibacter]|uniref:Deaminase n=1 Tax=Ramlibacter aquaticus TaxID=2780094 RepID=A0ABR9SB22_9BURK|nr:MULTISPECIES: PP0621 family protein [Ramlibacter]MBE7939500.1 hypothetical protein [Ramlibacter aquaticus]
MKYLVLFAVVMTVLWLARGSRTAAPRGGPAPGATPAVPQAMVACPACGLHLPRSEALPGPAGQFYCCEEHRARGGG